MTSQENCAGIITNIQNNLPKNADLIVDYLEDQVNYYISHPCYRDITPHIALLAVESLSRQDFHSFISRIPDPERYIQAVLDVVHVSLAEKNLNTGEHFLSYIQPDTPSADGYTRDAEYLSFRDFIEYAYFVTYVSSEPDLPVHPYLATDILFHLGKVHAEKGEKDAAYAVFLNLRNISPVNASILFELGELYRDDGDLSAYGEMTNLCFRYAWKPDELARAYRNMGYYCTEIEDYTGAITCYLMGTTWEDSPITEQELAYITQKSGLKPDVSYALEHGRDILNERGIPFGPNPDMIELMVRYADECKEDGDFFEARKYLSRAKALELSDALERQIEVIERFIEDSTSF